MGADQEREKEQAGCGEGWARKELTVQVCGKAPEPWLGGSLVLALTLTLSDLENHVQNDVLPQDGSTGSSAPCTVEMCWEAGTCHQSAKFGGCGRPEGAQAHRGHVGSRQSSSSIVSKQEAGLGF